MKLSIIMPVYNEEKTILEILDKVKKVNLGEIKKEIIIIDDASKDDSWDIINRIKDKNMLALSSPRIGMYVLAFECMILPRLPNSLRSIAISDSGREVFESILHPFIITGCFRVSYARTPMIFSLSRSSS